VEVSLVLQDDGGAGVFNFHQEGTRPETCEVDPAAQVCRCEPATYGTTSNDPVASDDVSTRVLALVKGGPGVPGANADAMLTNCIARADGISPSRAAAPFDQVLDFKFEAVDREGNLTIWPSRPSVTLESSEVTCAGDACGCCLLMSTSPTADPAAGGCAGLPGLMGVPGSGFENGLCHTF